MEQIIATGNIALAHAFKNEIRLSPLAISSPMYPDSQMKAFPRFQRRLLAGKCARCVLSVINACTISLYMLSVLYSDIRHDFHILTLLVLGYFGARWTTWTNTRRSTTSDLAPDKTDFIWRNYYTNEIYSCEVQAERAEGNLEEKLFPKKIRIYLGWYHVWNYANVSIPGHRTTSQPSTTLWKAWRKAMDSRVRVGYCCNFCIISIYY